jgi:uncharacterized protein YukE
VAKPLANPDELQAKARQLRAEADALDRALDPFDRAARGALWQGVAATQFKNEADADKRAAHELAEKLRAAANAMDAGASDIRRYLLELQRRPTTAGR